MNANRSRRDEGGFILINVLAVVAIASAVVVTMLTLGQIGIRRSQRFGDAAQALAWAMGTETSAIIALRRDAEEAPEIDHMGEPWATLNQDQIAIEQGVISVRISDAQALFNINNLLAGGGVALESFRNIVVALKLQPDAADRVYALLAFIGPVSDIADLAPAGFDDTAISAIRTMVTALPGRTDVNLNTASQDLVSALIGNPVAARFLISRRERTGFLDKDDLAATNLILPPGVGFTSNYFRVSSAVTVGDTEQTLTSLLERRKRAGQVEVAAISRKEEGRPSRPGRPSYKVYVADA